VSTIGIRSFKKAHKLV